MSAAAERARALIGVRFRAQGRDPAIGLDCIGLAAIAYRLRDVPRDYALRGGDPDVLAEALAWYGFERAERARPGALIVARPAARQLHLMVRTAVGFVHADAGIGRVLERPGDSPWQLMGVWTLRGDA